jgi:NAD(P)-dependent dehydrogenase (short-subunit alcohol dehydrogenase family)
MAKTAIITGADGGMGYEETKAVAAKGYHTIMACYSPRMAEEKKRKLIEETGNQNIEILGINLADLASVRRFADEVKTKFTHIDLLMNNAGTMETGRHMTVDGLERTVSVNYVGPYLLTRLLLPLMGEGSRIVNMASCVYCIGNLDFPDFFQRGRKGAFWRIPIYSNTKLAITLFTLDLAERVRDRGITVNAADPGIVSTEIIRMQMFFDPLTDLVFRPCIRTPRQGADTAIRLLLDDDKAGITGNFWRSNHIVKLGGKYHKHKQMQELWKRTEEIVRDFL